MLTGCTVSDYTVLVGNGTCDDIDVTQNHLQCQPPIEQPGQQSDGHMIDGALQVVVSRIISYTRCRINLHRMFFADFSVNSEPILMKFCKDYFRVTRRLP